MFDLNSLQILTLDSIIDIWDQPQIKDIFHDIVSVKKKGYDHGFQGEHDVLPFDGTDFIGTHQAICYKQGERLIPLLSFKSVTLKSCKRFNLVFPIISGVRAANAETHLKAVMAIIDECERDNISLTFDSSFTVNPIVHNDLELELTLHKIFLAVVALHRISNDIGKAMTFANHRFKTNVTFKKMGDRPLAYQGKALPSIITPFLGYSEATIYVCDRKFSSRVMESIERYQYLWEKRLVLAPNWSTQLPIAA